MRASENIPTKETAEIIFTGGRVHTVNAANDVVEALAIAGGRVLAVGGNTEILALAGPRTRGVDLHGRSLLPGFIDAHCHLTGLGMGMASIDCKAPGMQSIEALQKAVFERAAAQPPGTWIRGRGYDQSRLREGRHPNRDDWDAVAPRHPVIFTRTCGHIASVNSQALGLAAITDQTPDPNGGRYDRDSGRNLGVAYETAQTPLQMAAQPSAEEFRAALLRAGHAYIAAGCTSVHAAGVPVAGSSDTPVTHYAPLFGIEQALARKTMAGDICGLDERVDLTTAIRMHTINGAFASFEESFKGSLEVGKATDLVILAEDLSRVAVERLRDIPVSRTVVGGEVVHEA